MVRRCAGITLVPDIVLINGPNAQGLAAVAAMVQFFISLTQLGLVGPSTGPSLAGYQFSISLTRLGWAQAPGLAVQAAAVA